MIPVRAALALVANTESVLVWRGTIVRGTVSVVGGDWCKLYFSDGHEVVSMSDEVEVL